MSESSTLTKTSPRKHDVQVWGVIFAGVLMCMLAALVAFPQLTQSMRVAESAKALSRVLPGALLLSDDATISHIRTALPTGYARVSSDAFVLSAAHTASGILLVERDAQGIYNVKVGDQTVVQSTFPVVSADISPDGTYVVYAIKTNGAQPFIATGRTVSFVTLTTSEWSIVAHNLKTGENTLLGAGVHPFFIDSTRVAKIAPAGIYTVNLENLEIAELYAHPFPAVFLTPLISPDHNHVAVAEADTRHISMFSITGDRAVMEWRLPLIQKASAYALGNTALFALRSSAIGTDLLVIPLTDSPRPERAVRIPNEMSITRVIP